MELGLTFHVWPFPMLPSELSARTCEYLKTRTAELISGSAPPPEPPPNG